MIRLIIEFLKTGLFAVGGGMATIPFLQDMSEHYGWFTQKELLDMIAVSESTPGAIGINCATYAGYKAYGLVGGVLATISLIVPAIIIILLICRAMDRFKSSKIVKDMFATLRPSTAGLILGAMFQVIVLTLLNVDKFKMTGNIIDIFKPIEIAIFAVFLYLMMKFKKIHPLVFIAAGAVLGVVLKL